MSVSFRACDQWSNDPDDKRHPEADPVGRTIQTGSGRRYQLVGSPACDQVLLHLMAISAVAHGLQASVDVTEEVWKAIALATH